MQKIPNHIQQKYFSLIFYCRSPGRPGVVSRQPAREKRKQVHSILMLITTLPGSLLSHITWFSQTCTNGICERPGLNPTNALR